MSGFASRKPDVRIVKVSPNQAAEMLKTMGPNRPCSEQKVAEYATMMKRGDWEDGVATVDFNVDGALINGQHTLNAVIASKSEVVVVCRRGLAGTTQDVMDAQRPRSVGQQLALEGTPHANCVAATSKWVFYWRENGKPPSFSGNGFPSFRWDRKAQLQYCRAHRDELVASAQVARTRSKRFGRLLPDSMTAALQIMFADYAPNAAADFFGQLFAETDAQAQPIVQYRNTLIRAQSASTTQMPMFYKVSYTIKAFNAFMAHAEVKRYTMRATDPMPTLYVPEGVN